MWTWDQVVQFVQQIGGNFAAHQWLIGVAVLFGGLTGIWKGDINLPAPIGPWVRAEQAKRFSTSFQYITIGLVTVTALVSTMAAGMPLKQAVAAAISAALAGLFGHDAIKAGVKAGLKATPNIPIGSAVLFALVVGCVLAPSAGCAWLQSACGTATPAIQQAEVYTADAEAVITGTRITVASIPGIPADKLTQINKYLDDAETLVGQMRVVESAAISACAQPNVAGLVASLVAIWTSLEPLIAPLLLTTQPLRTPELVKQVRLVKAANK